VRALAGEDGQVDAELAAGEAVEAVEQLLDTGGGVHLAQQAGDGDGAAVNARIVRAVGRVELDDRVERVARGLDAHAAQHGAAAVHAQRVPVGEGFGGRLDGEGHRVVAHRADLPVGRRDGDGEQRGIDVGQ